jgi:hypothetical protein
MRLDEFSFGRITIDGVIYEHDVVIDHGTIRKRKKKPSLVPNGACFTGPKAVAGIPTAETASHAGNQNALRALRYSTDRITF